MSFIPIAQSPMAVTFSSILVGLRRVAAAFAAQDRSAAPVVALIWDYLSQTIKSFTHLMALVGPPRPPRPRKPGPRKPGPRLTTPGKPAATAAPDVTKHPPGAPPADPPADPASSGKPRQPGQPVIPCSWGWIRSSLPSHHTNAYITQLATFLAEPNTQAAMAASPQLRRLLRPLCRRLGLEPFPAILGKAGKPEPPRKPARSPDSFYPFSAPYSRPRASARDPDRSRGPPDLVELRFFIPIAP